MPVVTLTASGFGVPEVNGALADQGLFGAEHYYLTPGGYYFIFSAGDNLWVVTNAPPGSITGNWNVGTGAAPSGIVTA
jgi:hypothetical protein